MEFKGSSLHLDIRKTSFFKGTTINRCHVRFLCIKNMKKNQSLHFYLHGRTKQQSYFCDRIHNLTNDNGIENTFKTE